MPPEQLIYAAALASGSRLVYGDVPKLESIRRLWEQASLQELDAHFSRQAAANFRSLLEEGAVVVPDTPDSNRAFQILFRDREAAFCYTMQACSQQLCPQPKSQSLWSAHDAADSMLTHSALTAADYPARMAAPSDHGILPLDGGPGGQPGVPSHAAADVMGSVVGIVGEDHVDGIVQAWADTRASSTVRASATRKQTRSGIAAGHASDWAVSHQVSDGSESTGVKRALLERMLGLAIPEDLALTLCQQVTSSLGACRVHHDFSAKTLLPKASPACMQPCFPTVPSGTVSVPSLISGSMPGLTDVSSH